MATERPRALAPARIVYEDGALIVVDKPAGIPCQATDPDDPWDLPALLRQTLADRERRSADEVYLGTHQRLDRDSSGLLLYTRDPAVNPAVARMFESRALHKMYLAVVTGALRADAMALSDHLAPGQGGRMRVASSHDPRAKLARAALRVVARVGTRTLVELALQTGRTHQLRVQLAARGVPIAGDALYGGARALRLLLHAERLAFDHPVTGARVALHAPPPVELHDFLQHGARPAYDDEALLSRALELSALARHRLLRARAEGRTTAFRLVHDEADGLPGLALDVYDRFLLLHVLREVAPGAVAATVRAASRLGYAGVYLKRHPKQGNDLGDARAPGLAPERPELGEPAPETLTVFENGLPLRVRLHDGLRTGLFLDQRDNRRRVRELACGKRVCNLFAYTGAFSAAALAGGASRVVSIDASRAALRWAEQNVAAIGGSERHLGMVADVFDALARLAKRRDRFDLFVIDPPSYSTTKRGRFRLSKDYVALCRAALGVAAPGAVLLCCCNHHGVSQAALRRFVHEAVSGSGLRALALRDLPSPLDFPAATGQEPAAKSVLCRLA